MSQLLVYKMNMHNYMVIFNDIKRKTKQIFLKEKYNFHKAWQKKTCDKFFEIHYSNELLVLHGSFLKGFCLNENFLK